MLNLNRLSGLVGDHEGAREFSTVRHFAGVSPVGSDRQASDRLLTRFVGSHLLRLATGLYQENVSGKIRAIDDGDARGLLGLSERRLKSRHQHDEHQGDAGDVVKGN